MSHLIPLYIRTDYIALKNLSQKEGTMRRDAQRIETEKMFYTYFIPLKEVKEIRTCYTYLLYFVNIDL